MPGVHFESNSPTGSLGLGFTGLRSVLRGSAVELWRPIHERKLLTVNMSALNVFNWILTLYLNWNNIQAYLLARMLKCFYVACGFYLLCIRCITDIFRSLILYQWLNNRSKKKIYDTLIYNIILNAKNGSLRQPRLYMLQFKY